MTQCACRRQTWPGTDVALVEERCTVERRSDLTYTEFIQQYVCPTPSAQSSTRHLLTQMP